MPDTNPTPQTLEDQIRAMAAADPRIRQSFVQGGGDYTDDRFEATMAKIGGLDTKFQQSGGVFFSLGSTPQETADAFTKIHVEQYREDARPSLPALVAHHLDEIGLSKDNPHYKAAILVAARAEVDLADTPQYHNKNHYADVTAQVAEFAKKNNELAAKGVAGAHQLTPEEMADSITAAVGHDLDHPGGKNATPEQIANKEDFDRLRLEKRSFAAMKPLLREAGLDLESENNIRTMIMTTSPDGPHDILKAVAKAQQDGTEVDWSKVPNHDKFPELKEALLKDPKLTARSAMLEDADLGASAYEGLRSNVKMSDGFTQELQQREYRTGAGTLEDLNGPLARAGFTQFVVKEGPASAAAQAALGDNDRELRATTAQQIAEVKERAQTLPNTVKEMAAQNPDIVEAFGGQEKFNAAMEKIGTLDTKFDARGGVFFHLGSTPAETAEAFTKIHVDNYRDVGRPSLPALVAHHLDEIGLAKDDPHYKAALLVASRAEVDLAKTPQYHNTNHYADVTAQVAELVKRNNELAEQGVPGAQKLTPQEMADSITAAVGHDIEHPGGKNAAPGEAVTADNRLRLEEQSFKTIEPLLKDAGLDAKAMGDIHTMIQTTSPDGPHGILKAIAKAQQEGKPVEWAKLDPNNKMPELRDLAEKLKADPKLTARSAILEDSELGASAFEGLRSNVKMSQGFTQELQERNYGENLQGPSARQGFSDFVVGEGPASAAAQQALGQNYKEMYKDTRHLANQMKSLAVGTWQDGKTEGGAPFSRVEAAGLTEMQANGTLNAMKEAGLSPTMERSADGATTTYRVEGDDVARLHAMRESVIAKMDWKVDAKASEVNKFTITDVKTAPLGNDELKALKSALESERLAPHTNDPGKISVMGFNASVVQGIKDRAQPAVQQPAAAPPAPPAQAAAPQAPPPKADPPSNNGGGNTGNNGGNNGPNNGGTGGGSAPVEPKKPPPPPAPATSTPPGSAAGATNHHETPPKPATVETPHKPAVEKPAVEPPKSKFSAPEEPKGGKGVQGHAGTAVGAAQVGLDIAEGKYGQALQGAATQVALNPATYKAAATLTEEGGTVAKALGFFGKKIPVVGAVVTAGFVAYEVGSNIYDGKGAKAWAAAGAGTAEILGNVVGFGVGDAAREGVRETIVRTAGEEYAPNKSGIRQLVEQGVEVGSKFLNSAPAKPEDIAVRNSASPVTRPPKPPSMS